MADYPSTNSLAALDATTPAGTEVASKIDDAIRQIKYFLTQFLAVAHADTGALKASAVTITSIPDATITLAKLQNIATAKVIGRSTAGTGVPELLDATTAGFAMLAAADAAAQRTLLGLGSVALLSSIAAGNLATDAVETAKIKDLNVTTGKLADASVTTAKIADANVTVGKLLYAVSASDAQPILMIKATSGAYEVKVGGVLTASYDNTTSPPQLKFAMASTTAATSTGDGGLAYARLEEQQATGVAAGAAAATTWNDRGTWTEHDPIDMVSVSGTQITFKKKGVYRVDIKTPVSGAVGLFRSKLLKYNGAGWDLAKMGTSGQCVAGQTSYSYITEVISVSADDTIYKVQTYTTGAVAVSGLGAPVSDGSTEIYSVFEIIKL